MTENHGTAQETQRPQPHRVRTVYESRWLRVREEHYTVDGEPKTYGVVDRDHSVVIVPVSPARRTLLLQQYRFPTRELSWELPMGGIDAGETPDRAAGRELLEETGMTASRLEPCGAYRAVPGLSPQRVHVFLAHVSDEQLTAAEDHRPADDIRARRVADLDRLLLLRGPFPVTDGFTLASLSLLRAHLSR
jgi:8-oxo-dGTP pyrophosphatase MutT (NUDIX family)